MNKYVKTIITWLILSIASFILYYYLWWLADKAVLFEYGFSFGVVLKDFIYCAILTAISILACLLVMSLRYFSHNTIWRITCLSLLVFSLNFAIAHGVSNVWNILEPSSKLIFIQDGYFFSIIVTLISAIFISRHYCLLVKKQTEKTLLLERKLLKLQLDPHFMFNSLNILIELIHENPLMAEQFTLKLSTVYRYIITHFNDDTVKIHDAIHFIKEYCALLDMRYPDSFIVDFDTKLEHSNELILPLSLQLLIENAVKHNRHSSAAPLKITFGIDSEYIVVRNTIQSIKTNRLPSTGIGLNNLKARYQLQCNKSIVISKSDNYFEVKLPIIKNNENINHRR